MAITEGDVGSKASAPSDLKVEEISALLRDTPFGAPAGVKDPVVLEACNTYFASCRENGDPDYGIGSPHISTLDKTRAKGTPEEQAYCKNMGGKVPAGSTPTTRTCVDK